MTSMYKYNTKKENRRVRFDVLVAVLVFVGVIGLLGYVLYDLNRNPDVIDDSENVAILGENKSTLEPFKQVETSSFLLEIPESWVQVNNPEKIINRRKFYPVRYQGVNRDDVGKWLEIYEGDTLPNLQLDRAMKIRGVDNMVAPSEISPRCRNFTEEVKDYPGGGSPATWEGLTFTCTMNTVTNVIGAFETRPEQGVFLKGETNQGSYLFVYGDHSSKEQNSKFQQILRTFQVK